MTDIFDPGLLAAVWFSGPAEERGLERFPVALAWGKHLFPFRTEQLSPTAPMVLGSQGPGRVGRRRFLEHTSRPSGGSCAEETGGVLLSRALSGQVPSALRGLTALFGMGRGVSLSPKPPEMSESSRRPLRTAQQHITWLSRSYPSSPRPISTGLLHTSLCFQIRPINLVVYQGSYSLKGMGELISRTASRLDAFSGYPFRA